MSRTYFRYEKEKDQLNDASGLLITAVKKPRSKDYLYNPNSDVHPNYYQYFYWPECFLGMNIVLRDVLGAKTSIENLDNLSHFLKSEKGLTWVVGAAIIATEGIEIYHVGFGTPMVVYKSDSSLLTKRKSSFAQTKCFGACGAEIYVGKSSFIVEYNMEGGYWQNVPNEYKNANAVVHEYYKNRLVCDYYIFEDAPIVVHQYLTVS